jgi:predicted dehydrogenase
MIRYGIVGVGGFAGTWVRSLKRLEREGIANLEAAVIRNPAKYPDQVAALEAAGRPVYATLDEMLAGARGRLDVIGVPTGIPFHEPMAVQAMEAGYNVALEKPVAGTIQEVESIRRCIERTGRWCAVGYQAIYSPTIQWLRKKVLDGAFGALREVRSLILWPRALSYYERNAWAGQLRSNEGWILDGPATNATAHFINHMTYMAQASEGADFAIRSVRAELYRSKPIQTYDTSSIEIVTERGTRLYHYVTHSCVENQEPRSVFFFEKATVRWDRATDALRVEYEDGRTEEFANPDPSYVHAGYLAQVARVAAGQDPAPLCGLDEAGPQVLVINLAFESCRGILHIPAEATYTSEVGGSPLVAVRGIEDVLKAGYEGGGMISDQAVPWAQKTEPMSPVGYTAFPSKELGKTLQAML